MKNYFLLTSFYLAIGQDKPASLSKKRISIGPIINYNLGSISLGAGQNRAIRGLNLSKFNSFGGGLLVDFQSTKRFFFQTGLLYDTRTVTDTEFLSIDSSPYVSSFKLKVAYLNMPLMVGYVFGKNNTQPYLSAGLQIGKGLEEEVSNEYTEALPTYIPKNEPDFEFKSVEYGILVEAGLRQNIGQSSLLNFSVQYMGGNRSTFVNRTGLTGGPVNLGTKRIAINFAFLFKL